MKTKLNKKSSLSKRRLQKFIDNKLAIVGAVIILVYVLACVFAPLITPWDPLEINLKCISKAPSAEHWLGTDQVGRDLLARLLYGGRTSIMIGLCSAVAGGFLGGILGAIAGYFGGIIDKILVKTCEFFLSFPQILLCLLLVVFVGQGVVNLLAIFVITGWTTTFRVVRSMYFTLREESFVEACKVMGMSKAEIMFSHIFPNTLGPIIVNVTLYVAIYILQEAALSFIGLGVPLTVPTWGNILNAAKDVTTVINMPWLWIPPGLAISIFVLGINFFGDGLRDVFDPHQ